MVSIYYSLIHKIDRIASIAAGGAALSCPEHGSAHAHGVALNFHKLCDILNIMDEHTRLAGTIYAVVHDCCRHAGKEGHAYRAIDVLDEAEVHLWELFGKNNDIIEDLRFAIATHDLGNISGDLIPALCWDADRLDGSRKLLEPGVDMLSTHAARSLIGVPLPNKKQIFVMND